MIDEQQKLRKRQELGQQVKDKMLAANADPTGVSTSLG